MNLSMALQGIKTIIGFNTLWKPFLKPMFALIYVTMRCNLKCKMCAQIRDNIKGEMELSDFERLFSNKILTNLYSVTLGGGEPFLRKDLVEIVMIAASLLPYLKDMRIITNGTQPEYILTTFEQILQKTKIDVCALVSLDGLENTHDSIRGVTGTFNKVVATLEGLKEIRKQYRKLSISVRFTAMDDNIDEIWGLYERFGKEFDFFYKPCTIASPLFSSFSSYEAPKQLPPPRLNISEKTKSILIDFMKSAYMKQEFAGKLTLFQTIRKFFFNYQLEYLNNPNKRSFQCAAGISNFFIDFNGDLYPCGLTGRKPWGNIKKDSFDKIWYSDAAYNDRKWIKKGKCNCYTACHGYPALVSSKWLNIALDYLANKIRI